MGPIHTLQGEKTTDGQVMAMLVLEHRRHGAPVIVDVGGGYAGAAIERFIDNRIEFKKFNSSARSIARAKGSGLSFVNKRAEAAWKFREELDPGQEGGSVIALPPDPILRADLASLRYKNTPRGLIIESKDEIKKRIGRSPDRGDAVIMCLSGGTKAATQRIHNGGRGPRNIVGYMKAKRWIR